MTSKEAIIKSLAWRLFIAIPVSFLVSYWYVGEILESIELTFILNISGTLLYYFFDLFWFNNIKKYFYK